MTEPEPAPEDRPDREGRHDPWAAPPAAGPGPRARIHWWREIREALLVAVPVAAVTGVALGLLWLWRAPRIPLVSNGEAVLLAEPEAEQAVGADGWFLLLALAIGAVTGVLVFLLRRRGAVAVVLGLAVGALAGALLAWRFGVWFGPSGDIRAHARAVGEDVVFDAPLDLGGRGVLLGLPFGALAAHLLCTAGWGPREPAPPAPEYPGWSEGNGANGGPREDGANGGPGGNGGPGEGGEERPPDGEGPGERG
ncbi:ABC transporter permease [Streptomyces hoynatensis]|uniref:ABC transporter permease n=1 Tax=Streptomyces hoynatensis TaxID=1141874 RepID=UPI001880C6C2|nr:ABC transporter permease [Streptomyces hoynatensis]